MPFSHKNKNPAARITSKRQDFLTKKGISTANPSYVSRKFFFSHFLYIVYHIFRYTQIFNGFFQQNKSPGFFQGKMHFQAISGQIFQLFSTDYSPGQARGGSDDCILSTSVHHKGFGMKLSARASSLYVQAIPKDCRIIGRFSYCFQHGEGIVNPTCCFYIMQL